MHKQKLIDVNDCTEKHAYFHVYLQAAAFTVNVSFFVLVSFLFTIASPEGFLC